MLKPINKGPLLVHSTEISPSGDAQQLNEILNVFSPQEYSTGLMNRIEVLKGIESQTSTLTRKHER